MNPSANNVIGCWGVYMFYAGASENRMGILYESNYSTRDEAKPSGGSITWLVEYTIRYNYTQM